MEPIVVGTDGSPRAGLAVEWAAEEAALLTRSLRILYATERWFSDIPFTSTPGLSESLTETGERVLAEAVDLAHKTRPGVEVTTKLVFETPSRALRAAAEHAYEVVIGHRGAGGLARMLLGSTGLRVAGHAPGPVVVVRGETRGRRGEVLVGVTGSPQCGLALEYAFAAALARGAWVRAVHAWELPPTPFTSGHPTVLQRAAAMVGERLAAAVAPFRERYPEIQVIEQTPPGHAVGELVQRSTHADLLVVGARTAGALRGPHLGSVSHGVIHHADCPVAVVRPRG
jgi:nucleotide-binding universal stress UspA family protein